MEKRHKEYIEYYKSRMRKYENNALYTNFYQSEKALYEAIQGSRDLEEFGRKVEEENLAVKNAIALVKDHETARRELYEELKEYIRLHAPLQILEMLDSVDTEQELVNKVGEIEAKVNIEITVDLFTHEFYQDFMTLEEIEVYQSADVPDEWRNEINHNYPQEMIEEGRKIWQENILPNARNWDPKWEFDFNLIWEERHRRLIPLPDEIVKKRIEQFKVYRGL